MGEVEPPVVEDLPLQEGYANLSSGLKTFFRRTHTFLYSWAAYFGFLPCVEKKKCQWRAVSGNLVDSHWISGLLSRQNEASQASWRVCEENMNQETVCVCLCVILPAFPGMCFFFRQKSTTRHTLLFRFCHSVIKLFLEGIVGHALFAFLPGRDWYHSVGAFVNPIWRCSVKMRVWLIKALVRKSMRARGEKKRKWGGSFSLQYAKKSKCRQKKLKYNFVQPAPTS